MSTCDGPPVGGLEERALVRRRQEAAAEAVHPAGRDEPAVEHDEPRQILALRAQTVRHPGAVAGSALEAAAGVEEVIGVGVFREVRDDRPDDRQVVDPPGDVGEQVADRDPALAVVAELPRALEHVAHVVELGGMGLDLDRLAVLAVEPGLGVEGVDLGRPAVHVQEDHALRPRRVVARLDGHRPGRPRGGPPRRQVRAVGSFAESRAEGGLAEQGGERQGAEAAGAAEQHVAAGERGRGKVAAVHDSSRPVRRPARKADAS